MTYTEAQDYIKEKSRLGIVPGLTQLKELLRRLGNPQDACKTLHIAGTNGKGSVFAFVQEALLAAGYCVGRYISPTVMTYLERYQINRMMMTETEFAMYLTCAAGMIAEMEEDGYPSPTVFEIETAVAFLYFADHQVDYVLLECGMGGRLDATNVLAHPLMCVFAQISMDHMQFLGDSLSEIAQEKAGIIKAGATVISAPQKPEVSEILQTHCEELGCTYIEEKPADWEVVAMNLEGTVLRDAGGTYRISMLGTCQTANAVTAIRVLRTLLVPDAAIREGLARTCWAGRMTKTGSRPDIYVDGAHNEAAWMMLRTSVQMYFPDRRVICIIGVLKDKEYQKMVDILTPIMTYAVTITPDTPRGLSGAVLAERIAEAGIPVQTADSCADALAKAREHAAPDDVILVCGSLSFLSEYLQGRAE